MSGYEVTGAEVLRIASAVARRFKRKCWWADLDDLTSEAGLAICVARRSFDPQVGVPFEGYAARAAALKIAAFLWRQSTPVSGGMSGDRRKNCSGKRVRLSIAGYAGEIPGEYQTISHMDLHAQAKNAEQNLSSALVVAPDVEDQLDVIAWRVDVRRALREVATRTRDGHLAVEVLVHDRPSGEVMREAGRDVYRVVAQVRKKIRYNADLYDLWDRAPGRT